jgi:hypothetical protein
MDLSKARDGSLVGKYLALAVLLIGTTFRGLGWLKTLSQQDIVLTSLVTVAIFGTVDLNIVLEKLVRKGKADE